MKWNPWWMVVFLWAMSWLGLRFVLKPDHSPNATSFVRHLNTPHHPLPTLYFLGTSRVQRGIDPSILSTPKNCVFNVAMSYGTLSTAMILASKVNQLPGQKEIWIEITPYSKLIKPETSVFFSANQSLNTFYSLFPLSTREQILLRLDLYNTFFFYWLNGKKLLKSFFQPKKLEWLGFLSSYEHIPVNKQWFQTDHHKSDTQKSLVPETAVQGILRLIEESNARGNTVRFFLPLAFRSPLEREYAFQLFEKIPHQNKVLHDDAFLLTIQNPSLWRDATHMNHHGARVYSFWINSYLLNIK